VPVARFTVDRQPVDIGRGRVRGTGYQNDRLGVFIKDICGRVRLKNGKDKSVASRFERGGIENIGFRVRVDGIDIGRDAAFYMIYLHDN